MNKYKKIILIFSEYIKEYPFEFSILFFVLVCEGFLASIAVLAVAPLADYILDPSLLNPSGITQYLLEIIQPLKIEPSFLLFSSIFVVANILKGFLDVGTRFAILKIKYTVLCGLTVSTLKIFLHARWSFFAGTDQGKLLNTFTVEIGKIGDTLGHITTQFAQILQLIIYLSLPYFINPKMTLTAIIIALGFSIPFLLLNRLSYKLGKKNTLTANIAMGVLNESLRSARLILGYARQNQTINRYLNAFNLHIVATLKSQILSASISSLFQPVGILAAVIAMGISLKNGFPLAEMAIVLWSLLRAMPVFGSLLHTNISISNYLPSYEQMQSLRKDAEINRERHGERKFNKLNSSIQLKNVSFSYPKRAVTLNNINVEIFKGTMTALVGESGSGKSTISDLLLGLQIPDSGTLFIDQIPQQEWDLNSFREHVGYVPQESQLFNCSIRENLMWSMDESTENELWNVCRISNCEDFIRELPQGLQTIVGDNGVRLSGGQRQRIALARALLRKPELLILDEATSSLDSESERLIKNSINTIVKHRATTVFVIAHRLSTVAKADLIYVLAKGKIAEFGTYDELCAKPNGIFAEMVRVQKIAA